MFSIELENVMWSFTVVFFFLFFSRSFDVIFFEETKSSWQNGKSQYRRKRQRIYSCTRQTIVIFSYLFFFVERKKQQAMFATCSTDSFGEKLNQRKDVQWRQNVSLSNVHYYLLSVSPLSNRTMTESEYEMSRKGKKYYEIWFAYFSSFEISTTASFFSIINEETIRVSVMLSSRERGNIRFFSFIRISKVMHLFEKVKNNEGRLI